MAAAVTRLEESLRMAGSAAQQADEAVKKSQSSYGAAERAAIGASKALERINIKLAEQKKIQDAADAGDPKAYLKSIDAVAKLTALQSKAQEQAKATSDALTREGQALDKLKGAASNAKTNLDNVTKANAQAKTQAEELAKRIKGSGDIGQTEKAFGKLGGVLGNSGKAVFGLADDFQDLAKAQGQSTAVAVYAAAGIEAIAAVAVVASAALIAGVVALGTWAVGLANAGRSSRLLTEGITGSVAGGAELDATLSKLVDTVPLTREELSGMASDLIKSGKSGKELSDSLEEAATKSATLKYGPNFGRQMIALEQSSARFGRNVAKIFGGLKIEGLLKAVASLVDLFGEGTATSNAMKVVFESLFQPLIDGIVAFIPRMVSAFIQFEILVLKALITVKPWASSILMVAEGFGLVALAVLAVTGVIVALAVVITAVSAAFFLLPFALLAGIVYGLTKIYDAISSVNLIDAGRNVIMGLAQGITAGASAAVDAVRGVANSVVNAATSAFQIRSPSKLMADRVGKFLPEGIAQGIDDGAGAVTGSLASIANSATEESGASAGASTGKASINLSGATFNFSGVKDAEQATDRFGSLLARLLEGETAHLGLEGA
jgi:phage-related protein